MKRVLALTYLLIAACAQTSALPQSVRRENAPGAATFEFYHETHQESFRARTSDPELIARLRTELALPMGERTLHPHGALRRSTGGENAPWHWSYIDSEWTLGFFSTEFCDGWPSEVEGDLDEWVDHVKAFCPYNSRVAAEIAG